VFRSSEVETIRYTVTRVMSDTMHVTCIPVLASVHVMVCMLLTQTCLLVFMLHETCMYLTLLACMFRRSRVTCMVHVQYFKLGNFAE